MVDFSVFNELSFKDIDISNNAEMKNKFKRFFQVLNELKNRGLTSIRMDEDFKNYEISLNITFYQFFNEIEDRDFKERLIQFITMDIIKIDSPLIKDEEIEDNEEAIENEYFYNAQSTFGGLACSHIWDTMAVSFHSSDEWSNDIIVLQKNAIDINVKHASNIEHLKKHTEFFKDFEAYQKLGITKENLWERRNELFPDKIIFCDEVKKQIVSLDNRIFQHAMGILRGIELDQRPISQLSISNEGDTVSDNSFYRSKREFTLLGKKEFFEKHIKNFPNDKHRIHFIERDGKVYIGYIGKHLSTKKDRT